MAKAAVKEPQSDASVTSIIVISELKHTQSFNGSPRALSFAEAEKNAAAVHDSSLTVSVIPGANFITGKKLEEFNAVVAAHPDFLKMVSEGEMRVINSSKAGGKRGAEAPDSLSSIDDSKMAISIVQGTMAAEVLKAWQDEEERESVKVAIRTQLKVVSDFDELRAKAQSEA